MFFNYFKPSIYISDFTKIDPAILKKQGIKLFLCDLDNTLIPHYNKLPNSEVNNFIDKIRSEGIKFIIISNNTEKRVEFFSSKTNADDYYGNIKKPFTKTIKKILEIEDVEKNEVILMGDLLVTDILVSNFVKIDSILVQSIISETKSFQRINYFLEKLLYNYLNRRNILTKGEFNNLNDLNLDYKIL